MRSPVQIADLRFAGRNLQFALLATSAAVYLLALPGLVQGATFPRGDGFYFSIPKLVSLIAVYIVWMATSRWVDQDTADLGLPRETWNLMLFGAGVLGFLVVWLLPYYWLSFALLVI